ncbi:uncharacterized protein LOC110385171 [Bombyx mori]|uniref:Major facilitator superfamily (MFS) profile domain-containing protein n=1 Tax=Bombyx mori TaxID=7091 RepID=A0A8R2HQX9_BOMMO|nr:sugar transporter ERD6-like 14 [Bombyx mori]
MCIGFNASLFSDLKRSREIHLDKDSESWLASLIGITTLMGCLFTSLIIDRIGRRPAVLISSVLMVCGWITFSLASSFSALLLAKIFQGTSEGLGTTMGGIFIAEYSSPKYRGSFIATIPAALLVGVLSSHSLGLFYNWSHISLILLFCSLPGLIIAIFTPESPTFLATKGRYDECRWLRGPEDDDEVEKMIEADMIVKKPKKSYTKNVPKLIKENLTYFIMSFKKREFYIPVFIAIHLNAIFQFSGAIVYDSYPLDIHTALYGTDIYMFKVIASLDMERMLSTALAIYLTSRIRRRPLLFAFVGLNVLAFLCVAGYIYARRHNLLLPFDHIIIAIVIFLQHFHMFTSGAGATSLTTILSNELYPMANRGLCGSICNAFFSIHMFVNIKTAPYLFSLIGVDGTFCAYAVVLFYSLVVSYYMVPETKDKTLQEIEDKLRGYSISHRGEAMKLKDVEF